MVGIRRRKKEEGGGREEEGTAYTHGIHSLPHHYI